MAVVPLFPSPGPRAARGSGAELEASLRLGGKGSSSSPPLIPPLSHSASHGPSRPRSADQPCLSALLSTGVCGHALTGPPPVCRTPGTQLQALAFHRVSPRQSLVLDPVRFSAVCVPPGPDQNCRWLSTHIHFGISKLGLRHTLLELRHLPHGAPPGPQMPGGDLTRLATSLRGK